MAIMKWNPQKNNDPFKDFFELEHSFAGLTLFPALRNKTFTKGDWYPAIDVSEEKDKVTVKADLPGLKKEDLRLSVEGGVLSIRGERKDESEEKDKNYYRIERSYGAFERHINLGSDIDTKDVNAQYKDGVLKITLKKLEHKKENRITIQDG